MPPLTQLGVYRDGAMDAVDDDNALPVVVASVVSVAGRSVVVSQTPIISTSAYAAGDAVGGVLHFQGLARVSGGTGLIHAVTVVDLANQKAETDIVFFTRPVTATADNAALDPADTDLLYCVGYIKILASDYVGFNDNAVATVRGVNLPFKCEVGYADLWALIATRGTPTYAALGDVRVQVHVIQD